MSRHRLMAASSLCNSVCQDIMKPFLKGVGGKFKDIFIASSIAHCHPLLGIVH